MSLGKRPAALDSRSIVDILLEALHSCDKKLRSIDKAGLEVKDLSMIAGSGLLGDSVTAENLEQRLNKLSHGARTDSFWKRMFSCSFKKNKEDAQGFSHQMNHGVCNSIEVPAVELVTSELFSPPDLKQHNDLETLVQFQQEVKKAAAGNATKPFRREFNSVKPVVVSSQIFENEAYETPPDASKRHNLSSVATSEFNLETDAEVGVTSTLNLDCTKMFTSQIANNQHQNATSKDTQRLGKPETKFNWAKQNSMPLGHSHLPATEIRLTQQNEGNPSRAQHKYTRNFDIDQYLSKISLGKFHLVKHLTRSLFVKFTECHIRGNRNQLKKGKAATHVPTTTQKVPNADAEYEQQSEEGENDQARNHGQLQAQLEPKSRKFYEKRYTLFSKYDQGIQIDAVGWYSVTPEKVARAVAERLVAREKCHSIMDFFSGLGGNSIQFALAGVNRIDCIELDQVRHDMAKHNAQIYQVSEKINHVQGDVLEFDGKEQFDAVFASPPWGGTEYSDKDYFSIFT